MTANELAQLIEDAYPRGFVKDAANMLRQQEAVLLAEQEHNEMLIAEIEALKKEAALQRLSDFTQEAESFDRTASHMADEYVSYNEPVAWMVDGVLFNSLGAALNISFDIEQPCIPLYTHPAKTLTNEEIKTIYYETGDLFDFARAILKKASEK